MKDIQLTSTFELNVVNGDFAVGENLKQAQMLLLHTNKGEWKEHPTMGVGVPNFIETNNMHELSREIREQFSQDGMKVDSVHINGSTLNVEAEWK
jgi:hypothetical protein